MDRKPMTKCIKKIGQFAMKAFKSLVDPNASETGMEQGDDSSNLIQEFNGFDECQQNKLIVSSMRLMKALHEDSKATSQRILHSSLIDDQAAQQSGEEDGWAENDNNPLNANEYVDDREAKRDPAALNLSYDHA